MPPPPVDAQPSSRSIQPDDESDNTAVVPSRLNGQRIVSPDVTLERVRRFMPVMGITRIGNVTGLDTVGIPVVMVTRPNARSISVAQGKGASLVAAKVSGLMESIEAFHAENIIAPLRLGSFQDLRYMLRLADVHNLPSVSGPPFDENRRLLWIEGVNLFNQDSIWLPYELVHLDYTPPLPTGHGCFASTSNGLASGNHRLEAIIHGLCEVIERDATTLWQLKPECHRETRIGLETIDDPTCASLIERFVDAGARVGVWETTSDLGIPAFICRVVQLDGLGSLSIRPASGMGCHPSRAIALSRALTEAAQSRLTFIAGSRDDLGRAEYQEQLASANRERWTKLLLDHAGERSFGAVPSFESRHLGDTLTWVLARLKSMGVTEALMVDLTRPEFAIPVVRIVIPGLEGIMSPGRRTLGPRARKMALLHAHLVTT